MKKMMMETYLTLENLPSTFCEQVNICLFGGWTDFLQISNKIQFDCKEGRDIRYNSYTYF